MKGIGRTWRVSESIRKPGGPPLRNKFDLPTATPVGSDSEYDAILEKYKEKFEENWKLNKVPVINGELQDFETFRTLGCGSFGRVFLVRQRTTGKFWAMKVLEKARVVKLKQVEHTLNERRILLSISFPFIIFMEYAFKDNNYIYFVLPFVNGGEMFTLLRKKRRFEEYLAKFYAAQVVLGLEYLHNMDLVYRDLKPENILIDYEGFLKITDLGFCKLVKGRTWTLCGTPEYLAPEIILSKGYGNSADWWSFGILIYEMTAGYTPFYADDPMRLYEKIISGKFKYAMNFSIELRDLIRNLLQTDLTRRFGNLREGTADIKTHRWFKDINWLNIYNKRMEPPFVPKIKGPSDASNFDVYDEEPLKVSSQELFVQEFEEF